LRTKSFDLVAKIRVVLNSLLGLIEKPDERKSGLIGDARLRLGEDFYVFGLELNDLFHGFILSCLLHGRVANFWDVAAHRNADENASIGRPRKTGQREWSHHAKKVFVLAAKLGQINHRNVLRSAA